MTHEISQVNPDSPTIEQELYGFLFAIPIIWLLLAVINYLRMRKHGVDYTEVLFDANFATMFFRATAAVCWALMLIFWLGIFIANLM
jgi:hypothetical protein